MQANKDQSIFRPYRLIIAIFVSLILLFSGYTFAADVDNTSPEETVATPPTDVQTDNIARAVFTSNIVDREPIDDISTLSSSHGEIFYFTELKNLEGQIITHRWEYNGKVMAEVQFDVGAPRWRVYSSKKVLPEWTGEWVVTVLDDSNNILTSDSVTLTAD